MLVERKGNAVRLTGDGLTILLDLDTARRVGRQAGLDKTRPEATGGDVRVLDEEHPMWERASGGDRNAAVRRWQATDAALAAEAFACFPRPARRLIELWSSSPGRLFDADELIKALRLKNRSALAGVLNGFHKGCAEAGRTFPFYWWKGSGRSQPSLYAMRPSVAAVFVAAVG